MRRDVHLSVVVAAGVGLAVGAATLARAASGVRSQPVRYASVLNGTVRSVPPEVARSEFTGDAALVFSRIGDVDILVPIYLGDRFVAGLERTPWSRRFLIAVLIRRGTTGYAVRVRRIAYQRVGAVEQFCVIADVRRPGGDDAVERRKTTAYDVVSVPRAGLARSFTRSAVLRDTRGNLLSKGVSSPTRPALCRP